MDVRSTRLFAIFSVVLVVAVAVCSPAIAGEPVDVVEQDDELSNLLRAMESDESLVEGDPEYGIGILAVVAIAIICVSAYFIVDRLAPPNDPSGSQESIYEQLRQIYGEEWMRNMDVSLNYISSLMPADTTLWAFTTNYWNRAAELVVAEQWEEGGTYDANSTLEYSLMRENVVNYIYDWQSTVDKNYNNVIDMRQYLTGDCYGNMTMSVDWNGHSIVADPDNNTFYMDMCEYVYAAESGQYVYIDTDGTDLLGEYDASKSGTIYNFGNSTLRLTKVSLVPGDPGGDVISIPAGTSQIVSNHNPGLYRIDSSSATFAGPLSLAAQDERTRPADVGGCLVFNTDDGMYLVTAADNGVNVRSSGGQTWNSTMLRFHMNFDGEDSNDTYSVLCEGTTNVVRDWNNMVQQIGRVIEEAVTAGDTIYGIFDVAQESSAFMSPSAFTASIRDMNLSAAEEQAITIQGMMRLAEYWQNNEEDLTSYEFIRNTESVDLLVYGDIYYNGQLWIENAIFTPYLTVSESQTLTVGQDCEWVGPGFGMIWGQAEYGMWSGDTSQGTQQLVDLDSGYSVHVDRMTKDGQDISTITLSPTVIMRGTTDPTDPGSPADPVQVLDSSTLIMIILIELAVILFLLCYVLGQPVAGLVLALIVLAIALLFSDIISSILLGTFGF